MLQFFRNMFKSKIGVAVALGFLALIAVAFASGDVASSGGFGGVGGGDRVATVGKKRISTAALSQAVTNAMDSLRQRDPTLTLKKFLAQNGLTEVLDQMISRTAVAAFGEAHGVIAGDRLIDSEIAKIPAFQGPDGQFSQTTYRQLIQQRGLTDAGIREDLAQGLIARQLLASTELGIGIPQELTTRYASIITERRSGAIALLPSAAFAPKTAPTDAELNAFYTANRDDYIRPERRVIRYASFDESAVKGVPAPTEAEIAARFAANKDQYAGSESRRVTQLILPTEAAARAVLAETAAGKSLEAAASAKGLTAASIGTVAKAGLSGQSSAAVADATFAAARGAIAGPARSGLGWHLMRVDAVETKAPRTLDQVRGELTATIAADKKRTALSEFSARIEDEFTGGATLTEVAQELGLTISQTPPLIANGEVYGNSAQKAPPVLAKVLATAFGMEGENEPQLAEIEPGKTFLIFDTGSIAASAPAPLAEIRPTVVTDYQLEKGAIAARAAARKVEALVRKGTDLGTAMASLGVALPPVDRVEMARQEIARQQVPPPLTLLFVMAKGSVKLLGAPRNRGWYVVALQNIVPGSVAATDPRLAGLQREMAGVIGQEYGDQLRAAFAREVGVKRNETAIKAVGTSLAGSN